MGGFFFFFFFYLLRSHNENTEHSISRFIQKHTILIQVSLVGFRECCFLTKVKTDDKELENFRVVFAIKEKKRV